MSAYSLGGLATTGPLTDNVCTPPPHEDCSLSLAFWLIHKRTPSTLTSCTARSDGQGLQHTSTR